ncbi:MAG TPA: DUF4012 domain-containing protein [Acidimicrobiales bacterium]
MSTVLRRPTPVATQRPSAVGPGLAAIAAGVAGALLTTATPTGRTVADAFWSGALVAVVALSGATARRWTWFVPAGAGAAIAGSDDLALACAAAAIAVAFASVLRDPGGRTAGAAVTGLGCIALLRAEPVGVHGLSALVTAVAILPVIASGYGHASRPVRRRARRATFLAGFAIGLMLAGVAVAAASAEEDVTEGIRAVDHGLQAARDGDDNLAALELDQAAYALAKADDTLSSWFVSPAELLPVVGPNVHTVSSLAGAARDVAGVASLAAYSADVDALRFVDGRLDPRAVIDMQEPLRQVSLALDRLAEEVDDARSPWLLSPVSTRIDLLEERVAEARPEALAASTAVDIGPALLGAEGPRRYLVLFTTPVEARGRTGFPGNYAELYLEDGKLTMPVFGRVADLERGGLGTQRTLSGPPDLLARYERFDVATTWRNLSMTPDYPALAQAAAELYPQSGGQPVDGVLSVDPAGLAALMRYTGPVEIEGRAEPLTEENAQSYLLFEQYLLFEGDTEQRVDVLEHVARTTFERLTSADLPGPRAIVEHLDPVVDGGHIRFVSFDERTQTAIAGLTSLPGSFAPAEGADSFATTTANAGASKIDVFLHRRQHYAVRWDPATGRIAATLRVSLQNAAPVEGLPDYVIGNIVGLPPGTNRSYVSIYSQLDLEGARIGGQPAALQSEVESGRNVYSTFVDIPAGATVEIELDLSGAIDGHRYELDLPEQPFATTDEVTVELEVVGAEPVVDRGAGAEVDGSVVRWSSTRDLPRTLSVSAPPR